MKAEKILAGKFLKDEVISAEEIEIVEYGLENIESNLLGMFVTLIIGLCFNFLQGSLLLWLLVFPLRKNAGGFHAKTKRRCLLFSSAILIVSIIGLVKMKWAERGSILIAVFFFVIIFVLAPVENNNKHLDQVERRVYRKRTRIILSLEGILFVLERLGGL